MLKPITKKVLIADLQRVDKESGGKGVTRNFYRATGNYSEAAWQKFYPKFDDFLEAAGLNQLKTVSEIDGQKWSVFIPATELCTPEEVAKQCEIDPNIWELERFRAKDVTKDGDSPRFQISAFFKRRQNILKIRAEIDVLKKIAETNASFPSVLYDYEGLDSGNLLEINVPDAHFGKLAWPEETGYEPYDIKIASAMYMRAVTALIERTKGTKFEQVLYVIGNDTLNADDLEGRTTSGTQVTNDARYHKVFDVVRNTTIWAIEELRKIAPVKVIVVAGNHDQLSSWHLGDSIQCYFHKDEDVQVNNSPRQRKYHEFGNVMLMFTHGDKGERMDYPLLMATEESAMFGRTKFREAHTGHNHQTKLQEQHGVRVRILPALCPADDWHSENNYVGQWRNAEAYTWNRTEGLTAITIFNDNSQPSLETQSEVVTN